MVLPARQLRRPLQPAAGVPLSAYLGALGGTRYTAWFGIHDILKTQPGDTVVVSAAAGAVGSVAGQLARIAGARVVGICGTPEKCAWLTGPCGFDAAIDRRREDVGAALDRHCPDGIDVGFENVGGPLLDLVLARCTNFARIDVCGLIATYNELGEERGPAMFRNVLMKRIQLQGFIVLDYARRFGEARAGLEALASSGQLQLQEHIVDGLDNAPRTLGHLFEGRNMGKLVVRVADDPTG